MGAVPVFTVIVPIHNNWKKLQLCIDVLADQTYDNNGFEIIVVGNASTRNFPENFRRPDNMKIEYESKPGSFSARNRSAEFANRTYLS